MSLDPTIPDADTRRRLVENLRRAHAGIVLSERTLGLIELESERDWTESLAGRFDVRREAQRRGESSLELQRKNNWHASQIGREKLEEWWSLQEQEWKHRQAELSELQHQTHLEQWQRQKQQIAHWWQQKQQERDFHQQRLQEWLERQEKEYRPEAPGLGWESELDL